MSRVVSVLAFLLAAGCAGRWQSVPEPSRLRPSKPGPRRDYRVVLRNDSLMVLLDAVVRDDSIVELQKGETNVERARPPLAVAIADVVELEQWQPAGERVAGGAGLTLFVGIAALLTLLGIAVSD